MHDQTSPTAASDALDNAHYMRAVAKLGDTHTVVTESAIYGSNGIKLVDKGARVDTRLYDRLMEHKLREPLDSQLSVEGALTAESLEAAARALIEEAELPRMLAAHLKGPERLLAPLRRVGLPPPIAFKLTVMREQQPDLFSHSVQMMLVAVFLGVRTGADEAACVSLAAAGLLHDLGAMYMDPAWHDPAYVLTGAERRQLTAHPITSMLLIRDQRVYGTAVETAVLEHHERMDGTGYPRGTEGAQISRMGRVLMLAELASALFEKYPESPVQRLSLALRMNHRKFDAVLVGKLMPLLQADAPPTFTADTAFADLTQQHAEQVAAALEKWATLRQAIPAAELAEKATGACRLMDSRLNALLRALSDAGSHPEQQAYLMEHLRGDAEGLAEFDLVGQEAIWELRGIRHTCLRRWPDLAKRATAGDAAVADWCEWVQPLVED